MRASPSARWSAPRARPCRGPTASASPAGSTDATASVMRARCDRTVSMGTNRGKGAALRAGFAEALGLRPTAIVSLDADGQHDPACTPRLLAALDHADIVVGSRQRHGGT